MAKEYISKIVLELQPRSRRGYRGLFGIRENKFFNEESFDKNYFTQCFFKDFNNKALQQGQHIECMNLIVAVKQIKRTSSKSPKNTRLQFRLRGIPFQNEENMSDDEENGRMNDSLLVNILPNNIHEKKENNSSYYCPECKKYLSDEETFFKTENLSKPIVCLSCYNSSFAVKCDYCAKPIIFDQNRTSGNRSSTFDYVTIDGSPWHVDCCKCAVCLQPLLGRECYSKGYGNQLYCSAHCR